VSAWLFGKRLDLAVFAGSFALSMIALPIGAATGVLHDETPSFVWFAAVVLVDVAHVWSTAFTTYLDPKARSERRVLFSVVPIVGLLAGVGLYAMGKMTFWRVLAYLAIFHFVRQQYGWVSLYRARAGETDRLGKIVDSAAIYAATLYPLLYWHTHVPRRFSWFVPGDVVSLPTGLLPVGFAVWIAALAAYAARAIAAHARGTGNLGKDVVVVTTAIAWYVGIVAFDSDFAFTVTNVFMHGIPYFALVFVKARPKPEQRRAVSVFAFLGALWLVAFVEELLWDRTVWHDRAWLFGDGWDLPAWQLVIVPLLALPQLTHYVLDGFIWKRRARSADALDFDARRAEA
jgi:hypothetical protein